MQNKTKLFLISAAVVGLGFFAVNYVNADGCNGAVGCISAKSCKTTASETPDGYCELQGSDFICCEAKVDTAIISLDCCCEDTVAKQCTNVSCPASCGASSTPHNSVCSKIPNSATACGGVSGEEPAPCSTVCVPSSSCTKTITGSCSSAGYVCCSSSGGGDSGSGITFPTNTGLPTNEKLVKGIFENVANWLLSIIGIIAIISFVISGIQYFLVATDEKMMETAKKTMVASIIGLVVALSGFIAIKTVEMLLGG